MMKILLYLMSVLMLVSAVPMVAHASQFREVRYAHALSRAAGVRNPAIAPLDREIRQANAQIRDMLDTVHALRNSNHPEADVAYGQRLIAISERNRLQRDRDRLILSTETSLRSHLANIAGATLDVELLERNLDIQQQTLEQLQLRHRHGLASDQEVREAEHTLELARLNLEMLNLTLQNERQQLNRLMFQPLNANIRVAYEIGNLGAPPEEAQLERFIQQNTERDHNLLRWQETVGIRRHEWQSQLDNPDVDNTYTRLQHRLATLERDMAEQQAALHVRNVLAEWDRLVEQQVALEAALAQAQSDYDNMQSRLAAGMVTQLQVDMAALAVASQEAALVKHGYAFWIASLQLNHPYMRIN